MYCMKIFDGLHDDVDGLYECDYFERLATSKNENTSRGSLPSREIKGLERDNKKTK